MSSHMHHNVEVAGTTRHFTAWLMRRSSIQSWLGYTAIAPVDRRAEQARPCRRIIDIVRNIGPTSFKHKHPDCWIFTEAVGKHRARRTCSYNDEVMCTHHKIHRSYSQSINPELHSNVG